jgi:hypothetical protein
MLSKQCQSRTDITDELRMREVHLLDRCGEIPDVEDCWPAGAHQKGWFLDRIMSDCNDEIGAVDCIMDVVALRECGGPHVQPGTARDGTLTHLCVEKRDLQAAHELG